MSTRILRFFTPNPSENPSPLMGREAVLFVATAIFVVTFTLLWYAIRSDLAYTPPYRLRESAIEVPPLPAWVGSDFVDEVVYRSGIDIDTSMLDTRLAHRVALAFAAHPWVREVHSVQLVYPSGARVALTYRIPIAVVETAEKQLFPIDETGTVLELLDVLGEGGRNAHAYLLISGIATSPAGNAGDAWGDPRVHEAARLASLTNDFRDELRVVQIGVGLDAAGRDVYRFVTRQGRTAVWPQDESLTDETKTEQVRRLLH